MNPSAHLQLFLTMFLMQLPTLIVCLVACIIILTKRRAALRGASWALLGFGSVLLLGFVMPAVHTAIQIWVFQGGQQAARMWALTMVSAIWTLLHAATYVLLLLAVLAGRPTSDSTNPPPLTPQ